MFKLDNILSKQDSNNKIESACKYLLLKLVCAEMSALRNTLSEMLDRVKLESNLMTEKKDADEGKYRLYLPKIDDLRKFAKIITNQIGEKEIIKQ